MSQRIFFTCVKDIWISKPAVDVIYNFDVQTRLFNTRVFTAGSDYVGRPAAQVDAHQEGIRFFNDQNIPHFISPSLLEEYFIKAEPEAQST